MERCKQFYNAPFYLPHGGVLNDAPGGGGGIVRCILGGRFGQRVRGALGTGLRGHGNRGLRGGTGGLGSRHGGGRGHPGIGFLAAAAGEKGTAQHKDKGAQCKSFHFISSLKVCFQAIIRHFPEVIPG